VTMEDGHLDPALIPPTPPYYWIARSMAERPNEAAKHIKKGIDRSAGEFVGKLDAMQKALGMIRQRDPRKRLEAYYAKPDSYAEALALFATGELPVVYSWESQRAVFPRDYEDDWLDFSKLRERAANGDFGPEFQAREIAYQMSSQEPVIDDAMLPDMSDADANGEESIQSLDGNTQPTLGSGT